jgi:hypothetical protein
MNMEQWHGKTEETPGRKLFWCHFFFYDYDTFPTGIDPKATT